MDSSSNASASAPSLGLMKGVMLCNRPAPAKSFGTTAIASNAFKTGIPSERIHPAGKDPLLRLIPDVESKKEPTVLEKHKDWLKTVTAQREALLKLAADRERAREAKKNRVAERAKAFRELVRNQPSPVESSSDVEQEAADSASRTAHTAIAKGKKKPAWAVSERTREEEEKAEADELLDFAGNLDFEKYVDDLEEKVEDNFFTQKVKELDALAERTKARVKELEEQISTSTQALKPKKKKKKGKKVRTTDAMTSILTAMGTDAMSSHAEEIASSTSDTAATNIIPTAKAPTRESKAPEAEKQKTQSLFLVRPAAKEANLSASEDEEDDDEDESESDAASDGEGRDTLGTLNSITSRRPIRIKAGDDAESIATSIISSASSIRSVHSRRSLAKLVDKHLQKERDRIAAAVAAGLTDDNVAPAPPGIALPKIAVTKDTAYDEKRQLVSQLPYQHRNPAV